MSHKRKETKSHQPSRADHAADQTVLERVQELTWAMLDEEITQDEFRLLENLLLSDDEARDKYVSCVHLHAELMAHYAPPALETTAAAVSKGAPVLGFLQGGTPLNLQSSPADDVAT